MAWLASPWLWVVVALALCAGAWWVGRDLTYPTRPPRAETPAICAWCRWRAGDDCTHPDSPVSGQSCGPVCAGRVACRVREVRRGDLDRPAKP